MNTANPQYPEDDGPISVEYFLFLKEHAKSLLPSGKIISSESFFVSDIISCKFGLIKCNL